MKTVIYKTPLGFCSTTDENYNAMIQDERKIQKWDGFESAEEIIEYAIKYLNKCREDFIVR